MSTIESITLETPDPTLANAFYASAFGLDALVRLRASEAPTTGFRGFSLSLVVSQPSTVDSLIGTALEAGATTLKPAKKGFWGYGGVVQAPDGAIWKVATSSKKDSGPATRQIDDIVLLLGVADVKASKQFYVDHGLAVKRSFGGKYVEFEIPGFAVQAGALRHAGPSPRTPVSPRTAPDRTGSSSAAMPGRSPTRTGSRGRPRPPEPGRSDALTGPQPDRQIR